VISLVKIGPVKEVSFEFDQALYPESENEFNEIVKICIRNNYPFAVPVLVEPGELSSAITADKYIVKSVVAIYHEHCDAILEKVELSL